jgi:predicted permease
MPNLKLAVRMLAKTPFVTGVAVLSLGLGIGANAAIFSMFDQLLLKSLPVVEPRQLVNISSPGPTPGSNSCNQQGGCDEIFSYPMFRDLERTQTALAGIAASRLFNASLAIDNEPFAGEGVWISGQYFNVLGVQPAMGRLIGPNDDVTIGGHYVVNISYDLWNDRFGGAADVIGKTMVLNGRSVEVIGVTPREFTGATSGARPGFYVPLVMRGSFGAIPWTGYENRREYWLYVFGRLKEGTTMERAATELTGTYRPIINDVEAPLQTGMSEQTMGVFRQKQILLAAGRQGQSDVEEEASTPLYILFAVTGTVLLIACANIANLLLARGANRAAEMGVRLALGATRRNLIGQLLTESLILAMMGGAVSLVIAKWTLDGIAALLPPDASSTLNFSIDPTVILFAAVVAIVTGILFGLFPALHSTRTDLISTIRAGAGQIAGGRAAGRFRAVLVTAQIALSTALLISSGLFLKSLVNVSRVDLGVAIDDVVTFNVVPSRVGYDTARSGVLLRRIEEELAAIPGVSGMTSSMVPLIAGSNWGTDVRVQGFECGPDTDCNANYSQVGPSFFSTMEMRLIAGRDILPSDMQGAAEVAVVNQAFVDKFNLGPDPVGKFMGWRGAQRDSMRVQIVGVVENVRYSEVKEPPPAVFYAPGHARELHELLREIEAPAGADAGRDRPGPEAPRAGDAGRGTQDDAATGSRERLPRPHDLDPLGRIRPHRHPPRERRPLRRARLLGLAAHPRDRRADGARGGAVAGEGPRAPPGRPADGDRQRHRRRGGVRPRPGGALDALRARGERSHRLHARRDPARRRRLRRRLHAGSPGRAGGPHLRPSI